MGFKDAAKHRMLNCLAGNAETAAPITHVSLHTAFPAAAGNEISGGSPAYARRALAFEPAAGAEAAGSLDVADQPVFDVPAGATVGAAGFFTAASGGTLMADADLPDEAFGAQGAYALADVDFSLI